MQPEQNLPHSKLRSVVNFEDDDIFSYSSKLNVKRDGSRGFSNAALRRANTKSRVGSAHLHLIGEYRAAVETGASDKGQLGRGHSRSRDLQEAEAAGLREEGGGEEKSRDAEEEAGRDSEAEELVGRGAEQKGVHV